LHFASEDLPLLASGVKGMLWHGRYHDAAVHHLTGKTSQNQADILGSDHPFLLPEPESLFFGGGGVTRQVPYLVSLYTRVERSITQPETPLIKLDVE
jgi:hypothetical protein